MRRVRLDRRHRARACSTVLEQAQARRPEGPAGRPDRPGLDLRPRRRRRRRRRRRGAVRRAARIRRSRARSSSRPSCWRSRRRRSACSSRRTRSRRCARRCAPTVDCPLAELRRAQGRRVGHGRRDHHRGQEDPHQQGRPDDVRDARRPRGLGRGARLRQGAGRVRGRARRRRGRARARPRRPQGQGQDVARRAGGRAVRADAPRRSRRRARRPRRAPVGPAAAARAPRRRRRCRRRSSTTSSTCSATTPGETEVVLEIETSARPADAALRRRLSVAPTPTLRAELEPILGPAPRRRLAGAERVSARARGRSPPPARSLQ